MIFTYFQSTPLPFILYFSIISGVLVLIFIGILVYFRIKRRRLREVTSLDNSSFFVTINLKALHVEAVNIKNIENKTEYTYNDFLKLFLETSNNEVKEYLRSLLEINNIHYKGKDVVRLFTIQKGKISYRVLLVIKNVDKDNEIITLELKHLINLPVVEGKRKKVSKVDNHFSSIIKHYEDGFFFKGSFYVLKFKKKEGSETYLNEYALKYVVLDYLSKVLKGDNFYFFYRDEKEFEIDILDTSFIPSYELNERLEVINKILELSYEENNYGYIYDYTLVGSLVSDLSHQFDDSYDKLRKKCDHNLKEKIKYSTYEKEEKNVEVESWTTKSALIKIIRSQLLDASFRSIVSLKNNTVSNFGYLVKFKVQSEEFKSFEEIKKISKSYNNTREILNLSFKKSIPLYNRDKENYYSKLVIELSFDELQLALRGIPQVNESKDSNIVFLFNYSELIDRKDKELIKEFKNAQLKGYEIAFLIKKENFNSIRDKEIFHSIDMFFTDLDMEDNVKPDSVSFINSHTLLDKLVIFNKPIIVVNSKSFNEIELLYQSGVEYFSSDAIDSYSSALQVLDKKTNRKLQNLINKR